MALPVLTSLLPLLNVYVSPHITQVPSLITQVSSHITQIPSLITQVPSHITNTPHDTHLQEMFDVGLTTGQIFLRSRLNYDLPSGQQMHRVSVRAQVRLLSWLYITGWPHPFPCPQDNGDEPLSDVWDLNIQVTDVNDLDPIFTQTIYAIDVHENLTFVSEQLKHTFCI